MFNAILTAMAWINDGPFPHLENGNGRSMDDTVLLSPDMGR